MHTASRMHQRGDPLALQEGIMLHLMLQIRPTPPTVVREIRFHIIYLVSATSTKKSFIAQLVCEGLD